VFNLYFAAIKGGNAWAETGAIDRSKLAEIGIDPKMVKDDHDAITVIYVGNAAGEKVPLTPWTMAHRFAHAISRMTSTKAGTRGRGASHGASWMSTYVVPSYKQFEDAVERTLKRLAGSALPTEPSSFSNYGYSGRRTSRDTVLKHVGHSIGTMASARNKKLRNSTEFGHELMAQYIMNGGIKLQEFTGQPEQATLAVTGHAWGRPQHRQTGVPVRQANQLVNHLENELNDLAETVLSECVGEVFVM